MADDPLVQLKAINTTLNEILTRVSAAVGKTREGLKFVEDANKQALDLYKGFDSFLNRETRATLALADATRKHEQLINSTIDDYIKHRITAEQGEKALRDFDNAMKGARQSIMSMSDEIKKSSTSTWGQMKSDFMGFVRNFRTGIFGMALDAAKFIDVVDVTTKRALIGMGGPGMGIGAGSLMGGGGLGPKAGFMPGPELSRAAGESIANLKLMGQSLQEATYHIGEMGRQIGPSLVGGPELVLKTAELAQAFAKAGNISESTANQVATVMTLRFGKSAEELGRTMQSLRKDAFERARMSGEMYSSMVVDLAMNTRAYSSDLNLSRSAVIAFGKELKDGILTIADVSDMLTATRKAPLGQQAGIFQLGQQMGIAAPRGVKTPWEFIAAAGEKSGTRQTEMIRYQATVFEKMTHQLAQGFGGGDAGRIVAMRQLLSSNLVPGFGEALRGKGNEDLLAILNDSKKLQAEIKKASEGGGKTPMENLITEAQKITAGTTSITAWLANYVESGAFRVINKTITEPGIEGSMAQRKGMEIAGRGTSLQRAAEAAMKIPDAEQRHQTLARLRETATQNMAAGQGPMTPMGAAVSASMKPLSVVVQVQADSLGFMEKAISAIADKLRKGDYQKHQDATLERQ
jgi:hypothetical protein